MNKHGFVLSGILLLAAVSAPAEEKNKKNVCVEPNPQSQCSAANTCGSPSSSCSVDVKRTASSAAVIAATPAPKNNALFCVATGTKLDWKSESKNTGFVVDFADQSPFEPSGAIIGGSDRTVTVQAKSPGCYRFSVGACVSGGRQGMCADTDSEVVVTAK
jgi:hypothetical protein